MDQRLNLIYSRRSIRAFHREPLADDVIEELLKAAMAAPSARNARPWGFIVVTDQEQRDAIATRHPHAAFASDAGAVVAVYGEAVTELYTQDLAAATQNLMLAATALGLGTCWCGVTEQRRPPLQELLGLPEHLPLFSIICIGKPAEQKEPRTQYDPDKVHWQRYGQQR